MATVSSSFKYCSRCDKYLENIAFVNQTENSIKVCYEYQQTNLKAYYSTKDNDDDYINQNPVDSKEMKDKLFEYIFNIGNNEFVENDNLDINFSCNVSTTLIKSELHKLGKKFSKIVGSADGYYYIRTLAKLPRKHIDSNKQHDKGYIERFSCNDHFNVSDEIKTVIKKNIYFMPSDIFRQLEQQNPNLTQKQVHACKEIVVDATYNINALGYELYSVISQYDGAGFAIAYLFVDNAKKSDGTLNKSFFENIQYQETYPFIFQLLQQPQQILQNSSTQLLDSNNVANVLEDSSTQLLNSNNNYKLILLNALEIVKEQENIDNIQ
ncbi:406_t:CDS:2 [Dentiscutata erythropus]|uniref:406_t:CDS:1 n=1 Tax=Dentiscutata erythropus TaxID=1348616 RepID=A0A9N9F8Y7_9GLOM|nr:406_t:CDS:2 [Dentiscutata erythropus]